MVNKISWDQWSKMVKDQIQATRDALSSFFTISMEERNVSVVFCRDGHELNVGSARIRFDRDRPTAVVFLDADHLSEMGLTLSFETEKSPNQVVDISRFVLEINEVQSSK
jgi:hypothetical protein